MEAKAVPRPDPPQYAPLWQNVQRFLVGLGSVERMTSLLTRLIVSCSVLCMCCCLAGVAVAVTVVTCVERLTKGSACNQCMSHFLQALLAPCQSPRPRLTLMPPSPAP